jgi:hypothetical protein
MRNAFTILAAAMAAALLAGCESTSQYDGVSRFAGPGGVLGAYYGPGSPPRDFGASGTHG